MDIRNLLDYPAERITSYIPDVDDIIEDHLPTQPEDEQDDSQELPKITVVDAQKAVEFLETFWLQQDGDPMGFPKSVQQMKDRVAQTKWFSLTYEISLDTFNN
ncbi:unnamed protein product [Peronospora destructor]|uniref:Uncharacterized protein n=1 Tax=Peronospora destructor TaxID=86335 RepID=A0AAV0TG76_9STRA|nr:unnamed protein product [Peronospora destructor]